MTKFSVLWIYDIKMWNGMWYGITISCTDSPVTLNLIHPFCLTGFCFYWRGDLCYEVATSLLLQLIMDSNWQVRRSQTEGCCLHFSKERRAGVQACCLYTHWYCILAKPWELQFITQLTLFCSQRLFLLHRKTAFAAMPLLYCYLQQEKKQVSLPLSD